MAKTILLLIFIQFSLLALAQKNFEVSSDFATAQGATFSEIAPSIAIKNTTKRSSTFAWEIRRVNAPNGWDISVCDPSCSSSHTKNHSFNMAANERLSNFRVNFKPNGKAGIGVVDLLIYDPNNKKATETVVTFSASAQDALSGTATINQQSAVPTLYPNPAVEFIMIQDKEQKVKRLELYNLAGIKIMSFNVQHSGEKFNIVSLPRGMYMVQLSDKNGNTICTQRITKNNP